MTTSCPRRAGTRRCTAHLPGQIQTRPNRTYRVECSCGWSTPWWGSLLTLLGDVHAHRYPRRSARRSA